MNFIINVSLLVIVISNGKVLADVEVISNASALIKQDPSGFKQTVLSTASKAKTKPCGDCTENVIVSPKPLEIETTTTTTTLPPTTTTTTTTPPPTTTTTTPPPTTTTTTTPPTTTTTTTTTTSSITPEPTQKTWGYRDTMKTYGPTKWNDYFEKCKGDRQSPIAFFKENVDTSLVDSLPPLNIKVKSAHKMVFGKMVNNGYTFGVVIDTNQTSVHLTGSFLMKDIYILHQAHIHFGCDDNPGSEHIIDGVKYSGELHFVFVNKRYPTSLEASYNKDGFVILALGIKKAINNSTLHNFVKYAPLVLNSNSEYILKEGIAIELLFPPNVNPNAPKYYSYRGSLTTPPCTESVTWIIYDKSMNGHPDDFFILNNLKGIDDGLLCDNFRPTQPYNNRKIFASFKGV